MVIHGYVDRVMEILARHLNMTIPNYVPISPFKNADSSPVVHDSVEYESQDIVVCEGSKLVKDAREHSGSVSNLESSNTRKFLNPQSQVSGNVEIFRSDFKTTEEKLNSRESAQTELSSSTVSSQHDVTNMCAAAGDSKTDQLKDCSTNLQDEHGDARDMATAVKREDTELTVCELQRSAVPLKRTKFDHDNAAF